MLVSRKVLEEVAAAIYPDVYPIIQRDRELSLEQVRAAIKASKWVPSRVQSDRSVEQVLELICEF